MNNQDFGPYEGVDTAVRFTGDWKEFLPIAVSNFLLTIVTLGIYRFWAKARERRYLWSRTQVIGDPLEWTGTGKEMFIGFLIVIAILLPFYLAFQFLIPALAARGLVKASLLVGLTIYVGTIYLGAVGLFRALRYRLSRTYWRGIRGGSDEPGWHYGLKAMGYFGFNIFCLGLLYPWTRTRLWNMRWGAMSFGGLRFEAHHSAEDLYGRWLALYAAPVVAILMFAVFGFLGSALLGGAGTGFMVIFTTVAILAYLIIPLVFMAFWAKFYRLAASRTELGDLQFAFTASTWAWIKLFLGNLFLAIFTLGFGIMFWSYRTWSFVAQHLEIYGTVDVAGLRQSTTRAPGDSEGLADAFDIGAI